MERKRNNDYPKALFVLYGDSNKGKTTSLTELLFDLINDTAIINQIKKVIIDKNRYKNGCYIVEYYGKLIYISTWGDDRKSSEININFFYGIPINKSVYLIDGNGFRKINKNLHDIYNPDICITASRSRGESLPPILYLANKQFSSCRWQIWRHKMGDDCGSDNTGVYVTNEDLEVVKELKEMIDNYVLKVKKCSLTHSCL